MGKSPQRNRFLIRTLGQGFLELAGLSPKSLYEVLGIREARVLQLFVQLLVAEQP
jgi:hypothetical protein